METNETHQHHSGLGDNVGRDKITNIYVNTKDFQELEKRLNELQIDKQELIELITKYPNEDKFKTKLLKVNDDIATQENKIESFKADVTRLYETFNKIEINTERLRLAKEHFYKGEFREADALLNAKKISNEVSQLKQAKNKKENELAEINENLESKANEFLVKAQLWKTFYTEPDWFEQSCKYYEAALDASRTVEIVFQYANFLKHQNQFTKAQPLYEEALEIIRTFAKENPRTYLPDLATTLNNLANLHSAKYEFAEALEKYEEALAIRRALAKENPRTYLPDVATALNNLANLQKQKNEFAAALEKYEEALQIYRELAKENPRTYLSYVAITINNLGELYRTNNDFKQAEPILKEALLIFRELAIENPKTYLPYVAGTLNNLALLQQAKYEYATALEKYEEAREIYRALAKENPRTHLPDVAMTALNLSIFYLYDVPDKEKSTALALETIEIAKQFPEQYMVQQYAKDAVQILQENGVDLNEILKNQ